MRGGAEVLALRCDVGDREQVRHLVHETRQRFGLIDILVNVAGLIQVGPVETMALPDFEEAMRVMFWGFLHPILEVLPEMMARKAGRIVNITSIGGKVAVPHLLPEGIRVITIVPGLMRTGSFLNAYFKGRQESEYAWFSLGAALPVLSMDAERAARQIVRATRRGEAERILSLPAKVLARFHGLFPGLTADLLSLANRAVLPPAEGGRREQARGMEVRDRAQSKVLGALTTLGIHAAGRYHQHPGPVAA